MEFRPGLIPLDPNHPKPELTPHLGGPSFVASESIDYYSKIVNWGTLGNSDWGDCTCASDGHIAIQQTAYGLGHAQDVTETEVLRAYAAVSGFKITAGPPGANPTDRGATTQAALEFLRKRGLGGFRISAYGHVDPRNHTAIMHAIEDFGALSVGFNLPKSALTSNGVWVVVPGAPIDGGHCVMIAGYDADWLYGISWGSVVKISWAFWDLYCTESWAVISKDWTSVTGLSLEQFGAEFAAAFNGPNPFAPTALEGLEVEADKALGHVSQWFHKRSYRGDHARWRT